MSFMNSLEHLSDFQQALQNYKPSEAAQKLLQNMKLVLLVGPTSSGRNTIINTLLESGNYHSIVSDTTRQPRENNGVLEQNGREYWFRTEEELLADIKKGAFLEAAVIHNQQVSGISMRELTSAADQGLIAINEIEVAGADNIHSIKPDALCLFILPPSFDEWMARMTARGQLPAEEVRRRLESAVYEITTALDRDFYQFVVNDTFIQTAARIDKMITTNLLNEHQDEGRRVAEALLASTKQHLAS